MKIFVVYDSSGFVWDRAYTSFQSAIDVVSLYLDQQNRMAMSDGFYEDDDQRPAKMEKDFTYKDDQGGVLVAHDELEKMSTFVKELTI